MLGRFISLLVVVCLFGVCAAAATVGCEQKPPAVYPQECQAGALEKIALDCIARTNTECKWVDVTVAGKTLQRVDPECAAVKDCDAKVDAWQACDLRGR